jgi:L-lactate dehydrogenase complex protein LldE
MVVNLFIPCFIDQLYPETAFNTIKLLEKAGVKVNYNPSQTCCGQVSFNSGHWNETRNLAVKFMNDFPEDRPIVSPGASCTGFIRNYYPKIFDKNSPEQKEVKRLTSNIYEITDFLVNKLGVTDFGAKFPYTITYHDACSALREYGIKKEPRILLSKVEGLKLVEMENAEVCCGFGGTFSAKFKAISTAMTEQKIEGALKTGADFITSTEASCLMNMQAYIKRQNIKEIDVIHIVDILASGI